MSILPPTPGDFIDERGLAWRAPVGFDRYLVSFLGHVKCFSDSRFPDGRVISPPSGRTTVFTKDGVRTTKTLAQLVMLAWHTPAPAGAFTASRRNGRKGDNRAVNLFWQSRSAQNLRAVRVRHDACPRGHLYSGSNLYVNAKGAKCCRICYRAHWQASKLRKLVRERSSTRDYVANEPPITVDVILEFSPDGRFPFGPPSLADALAVAARLAPSSLTPRKSIL